MLVRLCSKSFKLGFSRMWTVNFQMHKLGLKRQRNQRSHCQHSLDHRESNGIAENIYFCFTDYTKSFVWIPTKCGKLLKRWEYQITLPISWEICMWVKKQQLEPYMEQLTGSKLGKRVSRSALSSPQKVYGELKCWIVSISSHLFQEVILESVKVSQSCPTLCVPMNYTVHGILQARILQWVAFPFSRGSSQPRDPTQVSHIANRFFTSWPIKEFLSKTEKNHSWFSLK